MKTWHETGVTGQQGPTPQPVDVCSGSEDSSAVSVWPPKTSRLYSWWSLRFEHPENICTDSSQAHERSWLSCSWSHNRPLSYCSPTQEQTCFGFSVKRCLHRLIMFTTWRWWTACLQAGSWCWWSYGWQMFRTSDTTADHLMENEGSLMHGWSSASRCCSLCQHDDTHSCHWVVHKVCVSWKCPCFPTASVHQTLEMVSVHISVQCLLLYWIELK